MGRQHTAPTAAATVRDRVIVFGWTAEALDLVRDVADITSAEVTFVGSCPAESWRREVADRLAEGAANLVPASEDWVRFEAQVIALDPGLAKAVVVLPDRRQLDPDAWSQRLCTVLARTWGGRRPNLIVEVADPAARSDFSRFRGAVVVHDDSLRAVLLGAACLDTAGFRTVEHLLFGGHVLRFVPVPSCLKSRRFGDAVSRLDALPGGVPVTVIGIWQVAPHATSRPWWKRPWFSVGVGIEPEVFLSPGHDRSLESADELIVLAPRWFDDSEFEQAARAAFEGVEGDE
jgi:hypothetical protein